MSGGGAPTPWTLRHVCRRAAEIARRDGLHALWFAALGETVYRRLVLLERTLDGDLPAAIANIPVTIEPLRPADLLEYERLRGPRERKAAWQRLEAGHWGFVARHAGVIVHVGWATTGAGWIDYLECALPLSTGEVFQYGSFTAPEFRGHGIASVRVAAMAAFLRARGYRRLVAAVLPENTAAFRPLERLGYRRAGWIGVIGVGPLRRIVGRRYALPPSSIEASATAPAAYWDAVFDTFYDASPLAPWHAYMQRIYARLIAEWLSPPTTQPALKTDLFEEAITTHSVLGALGTGSIGVDCSPAIARAARTRLGAGPHIVVADLRRLPLGGGCIGRILAGSSLDHFPDRRDIDVCLAELARVLSPGGVLVVTFDNPENPIVWIRNHLPFGWLRRLGLVPYYVGPTYSRVDAIRALTSVGLRVTHVGAVAHAPRAPAIWLATLAAHLPGSGVQRLIERSLERWEVLARLPTRYRTGYYVALRAKKDTGGARSP